MKSFFFKNAELPKKAVFLSFFYLILGSVMFCLGFLPKIQELHPFSGYIFHGAGIILLIPGVYFSCLICKAYRVKDEEERNSILREIPEM